MNCLVTGGGGFLAGHLINGLVKAGHSVRTFDLEGSDVSDIKDSGVEIRRGDLRDASFLEKICEGMEVAFHPAALASPWGPRELFWSINVTGTDNVIRACKKAGVKRLVHVSSPSAVFDGKDHYMADETLPYPSKFMSYYSETKAASEKNALAANGPDLETVVIRPHIIWGPGDRNLLPRIISRAKSGKLFQVGEGKNKVSTLYADNAVIGLMLAAESKAAPGNVYFLTNDEPVVLWDFVRRVLNELGLPGPRGRIPYPLAYAMASLQEAVWTLFRLKGEPNVTRYTAAELARNHTYSVEKAKRDLGYKPEVSVEEGLKRAIEYFKENMQTKNS